MKTLDHELDLDNPDDVDWLMEWAADAQMEIARLQNQVKELQKENARMKKLMAGLLLTLEEHTKPSRYIDSVME